MNLQAALESVGLNHVGLQVPIIPPRIPGIYFLSRWGKIVYVGQSIDVIRRIKEHVEAKKFGFDKAEYIGVSEDQLTELESQLIELLRPEYNRTSQNAKYFEPLLQPEEVRQLASAIVQQREDGIKFDDLLRIVEDDSGFRIDRKYFDRCLDSEKSVTWHQALAVFIPSAK